MNKLITLSLVAIISIIGFKSLSSNKMPQEQLTVYGQDEYGSIDGQVGGKCSEAQCLTIYVAPWCPQCARAKPMILKLTEELRAEGIKVSVIVGSDSDKAVIDYAKKYPFPVLLDADKSFFNKSGLKGVPFFISSNSKGEIIESIAGFTNSVINMRKQLAL